ncbi:hypothetical protein GCM10027162_33000 [Streptomyces incanus]
MGTIGIIGGTGAQGKGLGHRLAKGGYDVVLGSRAEDRAMVATENLQERGVSSVRGATNSKAAETADLLLLVVPFDGHDDLVAELAPRGCYVVSSCLSEFFDVAGSAPIGALKDLEDLAADHPLEASLRVTGGLPFGDLACDVRLRRGIESHPDQGDRVHGPVELPVAAAVETVSVGQPGRGRDRRNTGERGERGFRAESSLVRPTDQDLGGGDRPDSEQAEKLGGLLSHQGEDLVLELLGLSLQGLDTLGRGPHGPHRHPVLEVLGRRSRNWAQ